MSDNGRLEADIDYLRAIRENGDIGRVRTGLRAARLSRSKRYGAGVMRILAQEANYRRSTLYEYAMVARFVVAWLGLSARQIFTDHPTLSYSHLRTAARLDDFEDAIEALEHAERRNNSPDHFAVLVARWKGKRIDAPLFDERGPVHEVMGMLARVGRRWDGLQVRVTITRVK